MFRQVTDGKLKNVPSVLEAYGTSEGVTKSWAHRKRAMHKAIYQQTRALDKGFTNKHTKEYYAKLKPVGGEVSDESKSVVTRNTVADERDTVDDGRAAQLSHLMQFDPAQDVGGMYAIFGGYERGDHTVGLYRDKSAAEWEYSKMRSLPMSGPLIGRFRVGMGKMPAGMKLHQLLNHFMTKYKASKVTFVGDLKKKGD